MRRERGADEKTGGAGTNPSGPPAALDRFSARRALVEGEPVLVADPNRSVLLRLSRGPQEVPRLGVIDLTASIGRTPGHVVDWAGGKYRVVRPTLADLLGQLSRTTQVITPKDAHQLIFLAGVGPDQLVIEAGCGTGALTTVLAHAVGPRGVVVAYDRREEFLATARGNLERFGLAERVEFRLRDVAEAGFEPESNPSVVLDLPEPWRVVAAARAVLEPGGRLAAFTPTYNQLERTVRALRDAGFIDVRSSELLERRLHVGEGGTRPEFDMLGHTGFLTGARRWD